MRLRGGVGGLVVATLLRFWSMVPGSLLQPPPSDPEPTYIHLETRLSFQSEQRYREWAIRPCLDLQDAPKSRTGTQGMDYDSTFLCSGCLLRVGVMSSRGDGWTVWMGRIAMLAFAWATHGAA